MCLLCFSHACRLKPWVILTDLRDDYTYYWMDDHVLNYYVAAGRAAAWGLFDSIMKAEQVTATGVSIRPDIEEQQEQQQQQQPLTKRQCLKFERRERAVADLMDLEGFLEPADLRASVASQMLQELLQIPAVRAASGRNTSDLVAQSSMYA
jgi:hypothetical protein